MNLSLCLQDACTMEIHQSFGTDYRTVAACQLKMRDILDKPQGRLHATSQLIGTFAAEILFLSRFSRFLHFRHKHCLRVYPH